AGHARGELEQRQVVEAGRATLHRSARIIAGIVAAFIVGLVVFARDYVAPYESWMGQLVLCLVAGVFAWAFMRLRRLSETKPVPRFLASPTSGEAVARS